MKAPTENQPVALVHGSCRWRAGEARLTGPVCEGGEGSTCAKSQSCCARPILNCPQRSPSVFLPLKYSSLQEQGSY